MLSHPFYFQHAMHMMQYTQCNVIHVSKHLHGQTNVKQSLITLCTSINFSLLHRGPTAGVIKQIVLFVMKPLPALSNAHSDSTCLATVHRVNSLPVHNTP